MTENSPQPVAVGIDGTPAGERGVRFAAIEAQRLGVPLAIVHATPGYSVGPRPPIVPEASLRTYGLALLDTAAEIAQDAAPGVEVELETTLLTGGGIVGSLAACTEQVRLLVLGAERRSVVGRLWTGDIVAGVACQAECPVVIIPPEWQPHGVHGRIVVGVKSFEWAENMVAAGLALADETDSELVVMHAWKLASGYDDIVANRAARDGYAHDQTSRIERLVKTTRDEHPDVPVRIQVMHEQPAAALVAASATADRLLISRPRYGGHYHRLGGVGRAVLHDAVCPVEVHAPDDVMFGTEGEEQDR